MSERPLAAWGGREAEAAGREVRAAELELHCWEAGGEIRLVGFFDRLFFCVCSPTLLSFFPKKLPHRKDFLHVLLILCPRSCASLDPAMDLPDSFLWSNYSGFYLILSIFFLSGDEILLSYCVILWAKDLISCVCGCYLFVGKQFNLFKHMLQLEHNIKKAQSPKWFEHESCVSYLSEFLLVNLRRYLGNNRIKSSCDQYLWVVFLFHIFKEH